MLQVTVRTLWQHNAQVFNGYLTEAPSHRARFPATNSIAAPGTRITDAALAVDEATYYRRSYLDPSGGGCTINSTVSCSNAPARVWVEQRWYCHRALPSLMVMEVEVLTADAYDGGSELASTASNGSYKEYDSTAGPYAMLKLTNVPGPSSQDLYVTAVPLPPDSPYSVYNSTTLVAESNTSGLTGAAVLTTNLPLTGTTFQVTGPGITYAFMTIIRTTLETPSDSLIEAVEADYATAMALLANGAKWAHQTVAAYSYLQLCRHSALIPCGRVGTDHLARWLRD
jgi:hypothetical protein